MPESSASSYPEIPIVIISWNCLSFIRNLLVKLKIYQILLLYWIIIVLMIIYINTTTI